MKINEICENMMYAYNRKCDCGKEHELLTQRNSGYQEYDTEVYLQCSCGDYVEFTLPVN